MKTEILAERNPAYDISLDYLRWRQLIDLGLSPAEAKTQLVEELTLGQASHLAEILLARGSEFFRQEPFVFDIRQYRLDSGRLVRGGQNHPEPVVAMMRSGVENSTGYWQNLSRAVMTGMAGVEEIMAAAKIGDLAVLISPPEMDKGYGLIYVFEKLPDDEILALGIPVWKDIGRLADDIGYIDTAAARHLPDQLHLLSHPVKVNPAKAGSVETVFEIFTGLDRQFLTKGLENYRRLQSQIKADVADSVRYIAFGVGENIISRKMARLQFQTVVNSAGFESIAAALRRLPAGDQLQLVLPCGIIELFGLGGTIDSGVSFVNGVIVGSGELVACPVCSQRDGRTVKVHCAVGDRCPGCRQIRPC